MLYLIPILLAILVIATTIIGLQKKTKLCYIMYNSDGQTQTKISTETLAEIDCSATKLQQLEKTINKLSTSTNNIHKDINAIHHNMAANKLHWTSSTNIQLRIYRQ